MSLLERIGQVAAALAGLVSMAPTPVALAIAAVLFLGGIGLAMQGSLLLASAVTASARR